jgi:hypothetical protein
VQTNPFHFSNYQLYFKTPTLVAVAVFCWLVPIATLYPPGTLVVGIQPSPIDKSFNVSVFHHRDLLDIEENNVIAKISCDWCAENECVTALPPVTKVAENKTMLQTCRLSAYVHLIASRSQHCQGHV